MPENSNFQFGAINLLIYEEYIFIADVLSNMLNSFGIRKIHKARSLSEAKKICEDCYASGKKEGIDFAIVDLVPPKHYGFDFLQWTRHHDATQIQYMPIIFTTNDAREKIILNGRDSGANEILVKPYTAFNVSNRLINIINKPRAFVKCDSYAGPNRRRRRDDYDGDERRLTTENEIEIIYEQDVA